MKQNIHEKFLFGSMILFLCAYLFLSDYLKIPDIVAGVIVGLYFLTLSILGLIRHRVYFTRSSPIMYKTSILAKVVNVLFGILGIVVIVLSIIVKF